MGWLTDPSPRVRLGVQLALGALAVAAIVVVLGFPNDPAGWAVVALVVVLGDTFGQSFQAAVSRIQGSIVGCLAGAAATLLLPSLWLPARVAVAMVVAFVVCQLLGVKAGLKLGVALAGFFVFVPGDEEVATVGWRLGATVLGILMALVIEVALWPRRSGDALDEGVSAALRSIGSGALKAIEQWVSGSAVKAPPTVDVSRMRAQLAESRREPGRHALGFEQYEEMIAGIDTAALGLRWLADNARPGPVGLVSEVGDDLLDAGRRIRDAGDAIASFTPADSGDVTRDLYAAVEAMRSRHVTPSAGAEEITHLFAALNGVSLVAEGLRRASRAVAGPVPEAR